MLSFALDHGQSCHSADGVLMFAIKVHVYLPWLCCIRLLYQRKSRWIFNGRTNHIQQHNYY